MTAEGDFQLQQMQSILRDKCVKRSIDTRSLDMKDINKTGKICKQDIEFKQGIDKETAKKLVKMIKDSKIKVQTAIQGEELRVTGKKRDDLQQVIALIKGAELEQAFQYKNFRD